MNFDLIIEKIQNLNESYAIVTQIGSSGSAPADIGAKALVTINGLHFGTVGGGKIEAHCIEVAKKLIRENKKTTKVYKWNLQTEIKMTCGGVVEFLFEVFPKNDWPIVIFGAGHIVQSLIPILSTLNCKIYVSDHRQEWLEKIQNHPKITKFFNYDVERIISDIPPHSFILSITMGHAMDVPVLKAAILKQTFPYIGVIGSLSKRNALVKELQNLGITEDDFNQIHCPMGLPIGNNDPAEIAISITSELLKYRDAK
jgi:xanthine dehydrogenase accessory factor